MTDQIGRRNLLKAVAASPVLFGSAAVAQSGPTAPRDTQGSGITPAADSNPLKARIVAFSTVTPDYAASLRFYRDVMGFGLSEEGRLMHGASSAPGAATLGPRYALLSAAKSARGCPVRVLEAPPGVGANRPRPTARTFDPGLAVMECGTADPAESYRVLKNAGTPMISSPRYYYFRAIDMGRDLDVMSYAPFGPGGEQMFITANLRNDRPEWTTPGLHSNFGSAVIVSLDQRPVEAFYRKTLGLKRISEMDCYQRNANDLMGGPRDNYFLWGFLGDGVSIELEEHKQPEGIVYPTSLDRTGLAMITIAVNDLDRCRAMCREAGIAAVGEGALPLPGRSSPKGFTLRGAVGELVEVVGQA